LYSLGARISKSNIDILAFQEIESLGALREFISGHVGPSYKYNGIISLESNDPRGIDLGIASKFPLGRITTNRFRKYQTKRVFSRDCLQIEIMHPDSNYVLLTTFICHLKSKYSPYLPGTTEYEVDQQKSMEKRKLQVSETIKIVQESLDIEKDCFLVLGDMNDTPESPALEDLLISNNPLKLTNVLASIQQDDETPNSTKRRPRDTHKWSKDPEKGHMFTTYSQLDYILLSKALNKAFTGKAKVEQKNNINGSDHYLCWAELDLTKL
jgi:exonuclease III